MYTEYFNGGRRTLTTLPSPPLRPYKYVPAYGWEGFKPRPDAMSNSADVVWQAGARALPTLIFLFPRGC